TCWLRWNQLVLPLKLLLVIMSLLVLIPGLLILAFKPVGSDQKKSILFYWTGWFCF
ncbi:hypothetical protein XENOCAPTIV_020433, partial [Xenoophorus captivus]